MLKVKLCYPERMDDAVNGKMISISFGVSSSASSDLIHLLDVAGETFNDKKHQNGFSLIPSEHYCCCHDVLIHKLETFV